jgi:misacylated tRNA(Ala) deacylase
MTKALYMDDAYLKEWDTKVTKVDDGKFIMLKDTAFYPKSGGVEHDTGVITTKNDTQYLVTYTGKFSGSISHEVNNAGLKAGDEVHCLLDWKRRYCLMRYHTAAHVLSGMFYQLHQLKVTGNQLTTEKGRIDLNMKKLDVDLIKNIIENSNNLIKKDLPVETYYLLRTEAKKDPALSKLAIGLPIGIDTIRIVDIKGFDRQADGGCHVKNLSEIGKIEFQKAVSKGKNFKRMYFTIH